MPNLKIKTSLTALMVAPLLPFCLAIAPANAQLTKPTAPPAPNVRTATGNGTVPAVSLPTADVSLYQVESDVFQIGNLENASVALGAILLAFMVGSTIIKNVATK